MRRFGSPVRESRRNVDSIALPLRADFLPSDAAVAGCLALCKEVAIIRESFVTDRKTLYPRYFGLLGIVPVYFETVAVGQRSRIGCPKPDKSLPFDGQVRPNGPGMLRGRTRLGASGGPAGRVRGRRKGQPRKRLSLRGGPRSYPPALSSSIRWSACRISASPD